MKTFTYAAPFMGDIVLLKMNTPSTERINQYFSEQRKIIRSGDVSGEKLEDLRIRFFDEMLEDSTIGEKAEAFDKSGILTAWKEHCILSAFETMGRVKN